MATLTKLAQSRGTAYAVLTLGWIGLGYADRVAEAWRLPLMIAGFVAFAWAWMKVSPCAQGRCDLPKK